jgi:6-phosphogluconolactonase (cycloisomerase 2 family)
MRAPDSFTWLAISAGVTASQILAVLSQLATLIRFFGFRFRLTAYWAFSGILWAAAAAALFFLLVTARTSAQFAYVADADSGTISAYSIDSKGNLTPVPGSPFATGVEPFSCRWTSWETSPMSANFSGKNVSAYRIGPNGDLTPAPGSPFETGTAPVSIAVDPLGAFVFVANFGDNNVSAYAIGSNGGLIPVPGAPFAAGVK